MGEGFGGRVSGEGFGASKGEGLQSLEGRELNLSVFFVRILRTVII